MFVDNHPYQTDGRRLRDARWFKIAPNGLGTARDRVDTDSRVSPSGFQRLREMKQCICPDALFVDLRVEVPEINDPFGLSITGAGCEKLVPIVCGFGPQRKGVTACRSKCSSASHNSTPNTSFAQTM